MFINDYHDVRTLRHHFTRRHFESNPLPSNTDPTQDCPVSACLAPDGTPLPTVRKNNLPFNGLTIEQMTSIESRHRDKFDILGEQQKLAEQASCGLRQPKVTKKLKEKS